MVSKYRIGRFWSHFSKRGGGTNVLIIIKMELDWAKKETIMIAETPLLSHTTQRGGRVIAEETTLVPSHPAAPH